MIVALAIVALLILLVVAGRAWRFQRRGRLDDRRARALQTLGRLTGEGPHTPSGGTWPAPTAGSRGGGTVAVPGRPGRPGLPPRTPATPPRVAPPAGLSGRGLLFDDLNPQPTGVVGAQPPDPETAPGRAAGTTNGGRRRQVPGGLLPRTVEALAVAVVLVAGVLVGILVDGSGGNRPDGTTAPSAHSGRRPLTAPAHSAPAAPAAPTTTLPASPAPARPASAPVLVSLTPASGHAGQVLTLVGRQLFSPDGLIRVTFGGAPASIACSTQTTCTITVPPATTGTVPGAAIPLKVVTEGGASNVLAFSYMRS